MTTMGATNDLTAERARELFNYDEATGALTRRLSVRRGRIKAGGALGSLDSHGYLQTFIDGRMRLLHRVIWLMVYGTWPAGQIDHINGARTDNRLANLREASREENCRNSKVQSNNASGKKGVSFHKPSGKWQARISVDGKRRSLGAFDRKEDAADAYDRAALDLHGAFARTNAMLADAAPPPALR